MRPRSTALLLPLALVSLVGAPAAAQSLAICHDGGPGSTQQAAPSVELFLRQMETVAGLDVGSLSGEYHTARAACASYVASATPPLAVVDLATFLHYRARWGLEPIAHLGPADSVRYHVLVRDGSYPDLTALAGKTVISATPADAAFVERVVLQGAGAAAAALKLDFTGRPLKGVRKVAREQADATLVDQDAYDHLAELGLPTKLVSIQASQGLPGLTLVRVGQHAGGEAALITKVRAALPKLCTGDGQKLCKSFGVQAFSHADPSLFARLAGLYD